MFNKSSKYLCAAIIGFVCGAICIYPAYSDKFDEAKQAYGMLEALGYKYYGKEYSTDKKVCIWVQTEY